MKILFVNACMRGDASRTLKICNKFIEKYKALHPDHSLFKRDLTCLSLKPFNEELVQKRTLLGDEGRLDEEIFDLAHEFAQADKIIIGAPYWDFSFPAILKIYVEHISANKVAYEYTDHGLRGLCKAKKLLYITTSGGYLEGFDFGTDYFKGLCHLYGIPEFNSIKCEALDIFTAKEASLLEEAFSKAQTLAEAW